MSLKEKLQDDLKEAIRARDEQRKSVIRLTLSEIINAEVEKGGELDEEESIAVLQKESRKRRDAIDEMQNLDRLERLADEEAQLAILEAYLPPLLSREQIAEEARRVIEEVGATDMGQTGRVMGRLMSELKGRADGRVVNEVVRELLLG